MLSEGSSEENAA